ncbi:hypothetical protein PPACK8108_LOCUS18465 [Phakopsora pachyrhizi]|uniref:Uncharacterized protein n=1 Tax=Phakopsora pachyrhizi TaxID=170000 RepID=A0AAV0BEY6_PHAPC|nr:hypothetical protein PPACK8108_LOCUS18465 [Phakopsora pachyrhizi]
MLKIEIAIVVLLGMIQLFNKVSARPTFTLKSEASAIHEFSGGTVLGATEKLLPDARMGGLSLNKKSLSSPPNNINIEERIRQSILEYRHYGYFPYRNFKATRSDIDSNKDYPVDHFFAIEMKGKEVFLSQHETEMNHNNRYSISKQNQRKS